MRTLESRNRFSREDPIRSHFHRTLCQTLSFILKGVLIVGRTLELLIRAILRPFRHIGKVFFVLVLVNCYKVYLSQKLRFSALLRPAKNRLLFPFATRYVVHIVMILLAIFVSANSLSARELREEESFRPSLLSSLLRGSNDEEIVETAIFIPRDSDYLDGIGGVSPLDVAGQFEEIEVAATQENSTIVKPSLTSTTVGERPREGVIYHTVEGGETVSTIAEQYGVSINTILWENRLGANDYIKPGQKLTVLPTTGVSHQVKSGDTLDAIAKKYEAKAEDILAQNKLADASAIQTDQVLLIPNGRMPAPPAPTVRLAGAEPPYSGSPPPGVRAAAGGGMLWPTIGRKINQYFTYRHSGIDIDGEYTTPIYAAQAGRVESVGWGGGYGLHVVINHGNGVKTLYAHSSKSFVKAGQYVEKGQTIAMQGSTGWSTGVHLHFEVFLNGRKVNPLSYL